METINFSYEDFNKNFGDKPASEMIAATTGGTQTAQQPAATTNPIVEVAEGSAQDIINKSQEALAKNPTAAIVDPNETAEDKEKREQAEAAAKVVEEANKAKGKGGRPAEVKLDDTTKTIFTELITEGKLFGFKDGRIESKKDVVELIEANIQSKIDAEKTDLLDKVYASQTPAMQFIMNHASKVQSPQELIPLLTSISNIEKIESLDESKPVDQERIVRLKMKLAGDSDELIESEIQDLKDSAKLEAKAKYYKPALSKHYQTETQKIIQVQQEEDRKLEAMFQENHKNIVKVLESPNIEGLEFKQKDKGIIYELLAVPRDQYDGGVGIYKVIDNLFMKGDFATLSQVALLLGDKKAFDASYTNKTKMLAANTTARILQTTTRTGGAIHDDGEPEPAQQKQTVQRPSRNGFSL